MSARARPGYSFPKNLSVFRLLGRVKLPNSASCQSLGRRRSAGLGQHGRANAALNWDADFAGLPAIELPGGRKLETLAECAGYILELPKKQQQEPRWQQVTAELMKAVNTAACSDSQRWFCSEAARSNACSRRRDHEAVLFAFDLIGHDGGDLCDLPLIERKRRLARLIGKAKHAIRSLSICRMTARPCSSMSAAWGWKASCRSGRTRPIAADCRLKSKIRRSTTPSAKGFLAAFAACPTDIAYLSPRIFDISQCRGPEI